MAKNQQVIIQNPILNFIMIILMFCSAVLCAIGVYFRFFVPAPQSLLVAYFQTLTTADETEEAYVLEYQIYTNEDDTPGGVPVTEMKLNSFMDMTDAKIFGEGVQAYGTFIPVMTTSDTLGWWKSTFYTYAPEKIPVREKIDYIEKLNISKDDPNYLTKISGVSEYWEGTVKANNITEFVYTEESIVTAQPIDEKESLYVETSDNGKYKIKFKGYTHDKTTWGALGWKREHKSTYDVMYLFTDLYNSALSLGAGEHLVTIDLAKYFQIYRESSGLYTLLTGDDARLWVTCKINIYTRGLTKANESLFKKVADNPDFNNTDEEPSLFWQAKVNKTLENTPDVFEVRESNLHGDLLTIKDEIVEALKDKNINIHLVITDAEGLDYNALKGLKIKTITILTTSDRTTIFKFLKGSLLNSGVEEIIHAENITLNIADDVEFKEVTS